MTKEKTLSNLQRELLKVFSMEVSEQELLEVKKLLSEFFAQKAISLADNVWEEKEWTVQDADRMAYSKMRISKKTDN